MKLTNISGTPRAIPLKNGDYIEFAKGETKEFPDAEYHAIANRDDVKACFSAEGLADVPADKPKPKKSAKEAE